MPRPADLHEPIADARLPEAIGVVDEPTALAAVVDVLETHTTARDAPIGGFLRPWERPAPRLLRGHEELDVVEREGQAAEIVEPLAARGPGIRRGLGKAFVVRAARRGGAPEAERQCRIDQPHMFHGRACLLAPITARLLKRVLGALETSFRPVVAARGERAADGSPRGEGFSGGPTRAAASASIIPRRWANACKDRLGASPSGCRVACSTTSRT